LATLHPVSHRVGAPSCVSLRVATVVLEKVFRFFPPNSK
jgi:hypothetical protein